MQIFIHDKIRKLYVGFIVSITAAYCILEYTTQNSLPNAIFIGMLLSADIYLAFATSNSLLKFKNNVELYINIYMGESVEDIKQIQTQDYKYITENKFSSLIGISYALIFAVLVYRVPTKMEFGSSRIFFSIYLGFMNFITGVAIVLLYRIVKVLSKISGKIRFEGMMFNNGSTRNIKKTKFSILCIAGIYITLSLTSVLFSVLQTTNIWILSYTCFAIMLILLVYFLPELRMKEVFQDFINKNLDELNRRLYYEYNEMIASAGSEGSTIDSSKVVSLIEMKDKIYSLSKGSDKMQKINEVIVLMLLAIIPIIVQFILDKINF